MAAVLACGPHALLSHVSAAVLWELLRASPATTAVTVPGRTRHKRSGIDLHLVRRLDRADISLNDGIPVTSVPRTLLDVAAVLPARRLERAVEEAERLELFDLRAVEAVMERNVNHRGRKRLAAAIDAYRPTGITRSGLERMLVDLCRSYALPRPSMNMFVEGFEVDATWPGSNVAVELDSHEFHRTRAAFERDRIRDAALQLAGYQVIRITDRRLLSAPAAIAGTLRGLLTNANN